LSVSLSKGDRRVLKILEILFNTSRASESESIQGQTISSSSVVFSIAFSVAPENSAFARTTYHYSFWKILSNKIAVTKQPVIT